MYADISKTIKLLHFIPVVFVYILIFFIAFSFTFCYAIDPFFMSDINFKLRLSLNFIFYFCFILCLISYSLCVFTDPGGIPENWEQVNEAQIQDLFCRKCKRMRPERTHHCSTCNRCILKMDHHCPWIGNCIGFNNQKYFIQFLFYGVLGTLISSLSLVSKAEKIKIFLIRDSENVIINEENADDISNSQGLIFLMGLMISIAVCLAQSIILSLQLYFVFNNKTAIENKIYSNNNKNVFSFESKWFNFRIVFGKKFWMWFLPIFSSNKYNAGLSYVKAEDVRSNKHSLTNLSY
jgi:hypothetical protein